MQDQLPTFIITALLATLRMGPALAFAPPFTLIRIPASARVVLASGLAACVPELGGAITPTLDTGGLVSAAASELALGVTMALALQLAFAAIAMAGRALDIQAGFGLAFLIDPTTRAQTPLIGAVFSYGAAAVFVASGGLYDVIGAFAASFHAIPLGSSGSPSSLIPISGFLATVTVLSLGLVGLAMTVLFLIDLVVAMLSRTLPQMNVLVLGFQIKALVTLVLLPVTFGIAGAGIMRILHLAIETMTAGFD